MGPINVNVNQAEACDFERFAENCSRSPGPLARSFSTFFTYDLIENETNNFLNITHVTICTRL